MKKVFKRDGRQVDFDKQKIIRAIEQAMERTSSMDHALATYIADSIDAISDPLSVE